MKKFLALICAAVLLLAGCTSTAEELKTASIQLDKSSLEVAVPFELSKEKINDIDTAAMATYIKKDVMRSGEDNGLMIMLLGVTYDAEKIERDTGSKFVPSLDGGLLGAVGNINGVERTDPITDFEVNGMRGRQITGAVKITFKGDSEPTIAEFRMAALGEGSDFFMVSTVRKPNSDTLAVTDKIFNSIKIK